MKQAFPSQEFSSETGLSKIEYMATHILAALIAGKESFTDGIEVEHAVSLAKMILTRSQQA